MLTSQSPLLTSNIRKLQRYRSTRLDLRIRNEVKQERGGLCEACAISIPLAQLAVHHIFEARIYPELARERLNMLVLCARCHSRVTFAERFAGSTLLLFYSSLPILVRQRHLPFVSTHGSAALCSAFRDGDSESWNALAVKDLTR